MQQISHMHQVDSKRLAIATVCSGNFCVRNVHTNRYVRTTMYQVGDFLVSSTDLHVCDVLTMFYQQ